MASLWPLQRVLLLMGLVLLSLSQCWQEGEAQVLPEANLPGTVKLNELQYMGSHNSFHRFGPSAYRKTLQYIAEKLSDSAAVPILSSPLGLNTSANSWEYQHESIEYQFTTQKIRALEFDLAWDPTGSAYKTRNGLKLVGATGHDLNGSAALDSPGLKVLNLPDVDPWSQWDTFKDALFWLKLWSDYYTGAVGGLAHVPVIVTLDLLEVGSADPLQLGTPAVSAWNFSMIQRVEDEVKEIFPDWATRILSPDYMLSQQSTYASIRDVVVNSGWPTFEQAKSKILFHLKSSVLTGDAYARNNAGQVDYSGKDRLFFFDTQCTDAVCTCGCGSPASRPCATRNCATSIVHFDQASDTSLGMVNAGFLVRALADSQTNEARSGAVERRDLAITKGSHIVVTDFPYPLLQTTLAEMPWAQTTGYHVKLQPRCNPVTKVGDSCVGDASQDPILTVPSPLPQPVADGMVGDFNFLLLFRFFEHFVYDNSTKAFLSGWLEVAGLNTTVQTLSASVLDYRPPTYTPLAYAENIRDTPRGLGASNRWTADKGENEDHAISLGLFGLPLFILGVFFAIFSPICFCCPCCTACNKKFDAETDGSKTLRVLCCFWIVALAGAIVAFTGLGVVRQSVFDGTDQAKLLAALPDDALLVATELLSVVEQTNHTTHNITTACPAVSDLLVVQEQTPSASEIQQKLTTDLSQQVNDNVELVRSWTNTVFAIALVFLLGAVLVLAFLVISAWRADTRQSPHPILRACVRCTVVPVGIASVSVLCLLCGILLVVSAGFSDLCADKDGGPDAVIRRQVAAQGGAIQDFVTYRLSCVGNNEVLDLLNDPPTADVHLSADATPLLELASFRCNESTGGRQAFTVGVQQTQTLMYSAERLIFDAKQLSSCKSFNEIYVEVVHVQLCHKMLEGLLVLWVGLLLLTLPMMVILCKGGRSILAVQEDADEEEKRTRGSLSKSSSSKDVKVDVELEEKKKLRAEEMEKRKQERAKKLRERMAGRKSPGSSRGISFATLPSIGDSRRNSAVSSVSRTDLPAHNNASSPTDAERARSASSVSAEGPKVGVTGTARAGDAATVALLPTLDRTTSNASGVSGVSGASGGSAGGLPPMPPSSSPLSTPVAAESTATPPTLPPLPASSVVAAPGTMSARNLPPLPPSAVNGSSSSSSSSASGLPPLPSFMTAGSESS